MTLSLYFLIRNHHPFQRGTSVTDREEHILEAKLIAATIFTITTTIIITINTIMPSTLLHWSLSSRPNILLHSSLGLAHLSLFAQTD